MLVVFDEYDNFPVEESCSEYFLPHSHHSRHFLIFYDYDCTHSLLPNQFVPLSTLANFLSPLFPLITIVAIEDYQRLQTVFILFFLNATPFEEWFL